MQLPTQVQPAVMKSPRVSVFFGQAKIGKTTKLTELPGCLIVDTEQGTIYLEGLKVSVNSLQDLQQLAGALSAPDAPKYKYIALDVIDSIADWVEASVCAQNQVSMISEIPYGGGYGKVREQMTTILNTFKNLTRHLIVIGHRKKSVIGNEKIEFSSSTLDLTGKLKNTIMAMADAIGYIYRDEKGVLMTSFKPTDEIEAGSRCEHLKGKEVPFEWSNIFID